MSSSYTSYLVGTIFLGALTLAVFRLVVSLKALSRRMAMYRKFPQQPCNFIFGHLLQYPGPDERGLALQREMTALHPVCNLVWMMHLPMIMVNNPDTVKAILKTTEPKGERIYNMLRPWIGDGLLTSKGQKWSRNRKLLTPAFHFMILKNYIELKNRCADSLLTKFDRAAKESQPFLVFANITMFTLDVILRSAMSYETNCQNLGESHPYVQAVNKMSEALVERFFKPWLHNDFIFFLTPMGWQFKKHCDFVHKVAEEIINRRKETIKREGIPDLDKNEIHHRCLDFLDILLTAKDENGVGLTFEEMRDEVDTFLFEGHDTTASAISWALYSIAEHQDIQKRVQEEVDNQLTKHSCKDVLWFNIRLDPNFKAEKSESIVMRAQNDIQLLVTERSTFA